MGAITYNHQKATLVRLCVEHGILKAGIFSEDNEGRWCENPFLGSGNVWPILALGIPLEIDFPAIGEETELPGNKAR